MTVTAIQMELSNPEKKIQAARFFWFFAFSWLVIWIFLPMAMLPAPSNYDVIEQLIVGKEWVLGSIHHPPLPFWFQESVFQLCGQRVWASYVCGALASLFGLWAVWRLSRYYVSETLALLVVLSSAAYRYFNMGNTNFTSSVPPTVLWCVGIYFFFLALKFNRPRDWFLLGLILGAGMMSKFTVGILVVTMIAWLCWDRDSRHFWRKPGPWLTTCTALLVFLPHLCWMIYYDFPTIHYASAALSGGHTSFWDNLLTPLRFLGTQFFLLLPVVIASIPVYGCAWQIRHRKLEPSAPDYEDDRFRRRFLAFMIFVPVVLFLVIFTCCAGGRMRPAYGNVLWTLFPLWYFQFFKPLRPDRLKPAFGLAFAVLLITVVSFWADHQFFYLLSKDPSHAHFPGKALAVELDRVWQENGGQTPCPLMSGNWRLAGSAAIYMKGRPSVLLYYDGLGPEGRMHGFWATDEDLNQKGGLIVWKEGEGEGPNDVPAYVAERYPRAVPAPETISVPWNTKVRLEPLHVRYAIVLPESKRGQ